MKLEMTLELDIKITDGPLNINGVIKSVCESQNYLMRNILVEIIEAIDRKASTVLRNDEKEQFRHKGYTQRQFRTPLGKIYPRFTKLLDLNSKKICTPGKDVLDVPAYKNWLPWCLTPTAGLLAKLSYSNSSKEAQRLQGYAPGKSTIHRRLEDLVGTGDFSVNFRKRWFRYLIVDGTGARFQNRTSEGKPTFYEGEIRFAFAAVKENTPFELVGMWVNKSWEECAKELYTRVNTDRLEVLISDGGPGIKDAFLLEGMRQQRCQWHGKRDLSFILYADGIKKEQQKEAMELFDKISLTGLKKSQVEELKSKDSHELIKLQKKALHDFCELYLFLQSKGYMKAAEYIYHLAKPFVAFIDQFIETGKMTHTTSNIIEGKIGLFKNRIKSIGRRWSEKGLVKWLALAVRKLLPEYRWETLWDDITGKTLPVEIKLDLIQTSVVCH